MLTTTDGWRRTDCDVLERDAAVNYVWMTVVLCDAIANNRQPSVTSVTPKCSGRPRQQRTSIIASRTACMPNIYRHSCSRLFAEVVGRGPLGVAWWGLALMLVAWQYEEWKQRRRGRFLQTTLVVQVKQSVRCVSLCVCPDNNFELNDIWPRYLACWFTLTISGSSSKVNFIAQSGRLQDEKVPFSVRDAHGTTWRNFGCLWSSLCWRDDVSLAFVNIDLRKHRFFYDGLNNEHYYEDHYNDASQTVKKSDEDMKVVIITLHTCVTTPSWHQHISSPCNVAVPKVGNSPKMCTWFRSSPIAGQARPTRLGMWQFVLETRSTR